MIKSIIKVKSIYVISLLLIPILLLAINMETDFAKATVKSNDILKLTNEVSITDTPILNSLRPHVDSFTIEYDTTGDGQGPCADDKPRINATITDDGNVTAADIYFKEGFSEYLFNAMSQSELDETQWSGYISSSDRGTKVSWCIRALDDEFQDNNPPYDHPESYTIINGAPIIEIISPIAGENITSTTLNITWTADDPDDDIMTFDVFYKRDNKDWKAIVESTEELSYLWDISKAKYSETYQIKIVAYDGHEGVTEAITPYELTLGTVDSGSISILIMSLVVITSISIYFKQKKRK